MKALNYVTLAVLVLFSINGISQSNIENKTEKSYIEVKGIAEKLIMPDEIFIAITIRERHEGKVKITIAKQELALKEALTSLGVSIDNLSVSQVNSNYVKVNWSKKDVITKTRYELKVGDALTTGKVFEKLDELQIVDANISHVSHSKLSEFKKQVRIMAIMAAKNKADYLLNAIGEETGKPMIINELSSHYSNNSNVNVRGARSDANYYVMDGVKVLGESEKKVIQFQMIKVKASIYVKFEIK